MKNNLFADFDLPSSYISHCPEETQQYARELAKKFLASSFNGHVLALKGNLGAGKTLFCKAFISEATGLSMEAVTSPTFVYVNTYSTPKGPLQHFDCYRLTHQEAFYEWGLDEPLNEAWLALIEWPEKVPSILPSPYLELHLQHADLQKRELQLQEVV